MTRHVAFAAVFSAVLLAAISCGGEAPSNVVSIEKSREYQDPALLAEAWQLPVAAAYQKAGFASQENGSLCGMASTANLMRSRGQAAPSQKSLIIGVLSPLFGVELGGVTLDQLQGIVSKASGRPVTLLRNLSRVDFRQQLLRVNDPAHRYIVNFTRKPLFGRGHGHFSPLGGYLPRADLVFVLDVNSEFKPFLVKADRLFEAVDTVDSSSNEKRGLLRVD